MSSKNLTQVALKQFSINGFEGTTLATIGEECGIKKQSIYSHFKSKDELFLSAYEEALAKELNYVYQWIAKHERESIRVILSSFIDDYFSRYLTDYSMTFFFRYAFFTPVQFKLHVDEGTNLFISELERLFIKIFNQKKDYIMCSFSSSDCALSYLTLFDGLVVELLYGSEERLTQRKNAALDLFLHALLKDE